MRVGQRLDREIFLEVCDARECCFECRAGCADSSFVVNMKWRAKMLSDGGQHQGKPGRKFRRCRHYKYPSVSDLSCASLSIRRDAGERCPNIYTKSITFVNA